MNNDRIRQDKEEAPASSANNRYPRLRGLLESGLPVHPRPYSLLAEQTGLTEREVLEKVRQWQSDGLFRRFGLVVRHRALGFNANAMLVIDVDDSEVDAVGELLAKTDAVTLCYRRKKQPPAWTYNLFCMIHGRDREIVRTQAESLLARHGLDKLPHALLFSLREFKQRGARYFHDGKMDDA
ncbi:MAG: AsnC family protein [Betaproteobacteria bacterium]|nr:AsnC family protein [Betaproteobacteria bacterium]